MEKSIEKTTEALNAETTNTMTPEQMFQEQANIIYEKSRSFYDIGKALNVIREKKLFAAMAEANEDEAFVKWFSFTPARVTQLTQATEVMDKVAEALTIVNHGKKAEDCIPLPANEAQCRELKKSKPEHWGSDWIKIYEMFNRIPTALEIKENRTKGEFKGKSGRGAEIDFVNRLEKAFASLTGCPFDTLKISEDKKEETRASVESLIHNLQALLERLNESEVAEQE